MSKIKLDTVKLELAKSAADKLLCAGWKPNGEFELPYPIFKEDIELLKVCADRMTGKAPVWKEEHWGKHNWALDENLDIDEFAMADERGYHNGPLCIRCNKWFCKHCVDDYEEALNEETCDTSHWACPTCGFPIQKPLHNDESYDFYCEHCGQHIIK